MRLIMRIRVSSATTTSPKNNRTANTDTHSHSVRAGDCNFYYTYVHLVLSVFPTRGKTVWAWFAFQLFRENAWTCHVFFCSAAAY